MNELGIQFCITCLFMVIHRDKTIKLSWYFCNVLIMINVLLIVTCRFGKLEIILKEKINRKIVNDETISKNNLHRKCKSTFLVEVIATRSLLSSSRTGWPLWNIHFSNSYGSFPFYVYCVFSHWFMTEMIFTW